MDRKVGLGILGLGWWGSVLTEAVARTDGAEVLSCYARGEEGRLSFAEEHGCRAAGSLEELLEDPQIEGVLIATSHSSHRKLIEQVAAAGKHIFVEKPLTTTVADARACVEAAQAGGVLLQVGHQRRRTPAERRMKEMVDSGEIGDVETVVAHQSIPNGFKMPDTAWRWDPDQSPLGSMTSLGVHKIDSMHFLVGPIRSVFAFTREGRSRPIDEGTVVAVEFESGALGTLTTSFFTPVINEIAVFGTELAAYSSQGGDRLEIQRRGEAGREEVTLSPVDPVEEQLEDFARAIRGEIPVEVDGEAGLAVVAVLEAAGESAKSGRAVEVATTRN